VRSGCRIGVGLLVIEIVQGAKITIDLRLNLLSGMLPLRGLRRPLAAGPFEFRAR
jgi:hypothetical protein